MVTLAVWVGLTDMITGLDNEGFPLEHMALEVIWQTTTSPLVGNHENAELFVPELTPFTFHWYEGAVPPFIGNA